MNTIPGIVTRKVADTQTFEDHADIAVGVTMVLAALMLVVLSLS